MLASEISDILSTMKYEVPRPARPLWLVLAIVHAVNGQAQLPNVEEQSIRALIKTFADARNAHDGEAVAALYSEDGQWIAADGVKIVRGRAALAALWASVPGQVQRTIQSVDFPSNNIAVVRVVTQYEEPIGRHGETFIVVKEYGKDLGQWKIRVHQTVH